MNRYDNLYSKLSGAALITAPIFLVCAALIKAAGIGSTTGRWYDSWLEGTLTYLGMSLMIIAVLALSRIVGQRSPVLGIVTAVLGVLGTTASMFPTSARITGANALASGISIEHLDILYGGSDVVVSRPPNLIAPFLMLFFLNFLLLAFGLWRVKEIPRYSPLLLVTGVVLFMVAQSPFEVIVPAYIASTIAWLLAMLPPGIALLRSDKQLVAAAS